MSQLQVIEHGDQRVLITAQLAEVFDAEISTVTKNFSRNRDRYTEGKHYFELRGRELEKFKGSGQIVANLKFAPVLYLWTEKGAWMHAKSLNTSKAWEAYEMLVDDYYRIKEQTIAIPRTYPEALRLAADLAEENVQKEQIIQELQPKASYCDQILQSENTVTITQIAKDYDLTGQQLNKILNEEKVQYKRNSQWLLYHPHQGKGYTDSETRNVAGDGETVAKMHTRWTQKERLFIHEVLQERGVYALIDRPREESAS